MMCLYIFLCTTIFGEQKLCDILLCSRGPKMLDHREEPVPAYFKFPPLPN